MLYYSVMPMPLAILLTAAAVPTMPPAIDRVVTTFPTRDCPKPPPMLVGLKRCPGLPPMLVAPLR